jgi:rare lipoprotein A
MERWLVILSLAAVQCPDIAVASPKSADVPLWKTLDQAEPFNAVSTPVSPKPAAESVHMPPTKSTGVDAGCNGGRRVISAVYRHGQRTASGEPFNPQGMTAAHRTLPFGTHLTVTNPRTGKSVVVVVNDRGPFVSGVGLDLSFGAAQAIGMRSNGAVCIW